MNPHDLYGRKNPTPEISPLLIVVGVGVVATVVLTSIFVNVVGATLGRSVGQGAVDVTRT